MSRVKVVGIYKITSPSGRVYIGQSWDILQRWFTYRGSNAKGQRVLNSSFLKHGARSHVYEIVHELPTDVDQGMLNQYECFYIDLYRQAGVKMLNIKEGGYGGRHSEETRILIGMKGKGRKGSSTSFKSGESRERTPEWCNRISESLRGKTHSETTKTKIRAKRRLQIIKHSVETIEKIAAKHRGMKASDESRKKMSESKKGNKNRLGKGHSQETKDKISDTKKRKAQPIKK